MKDNNIEYIYCKNKNSTGGIAINKNTNEIININEYRDNYALDKDIVKIKIYTNKYGSKYAKITEITRHSITHIVGKVSLNKSGTLFLNSTHKSITLPIHVHSYHKTVDFTELYNSIITKYPDKNKPYFEVKILNSIGKIEDDNAFLNKILIENNVPTSFHKNTIKQSEEISDVIPDEEIQKRKDLRNLAFVTIDGIDAKDFDDAVYCKVHGEIFTLFVAIADVSHYVTQDSPLDREALLRGTSVYVPKKVIPMLPEHLSNGLCSLNPHVDRLTLCAEMNINKKGEIINYEIYKAVIKSHARLTYEQVEQWIHDLSSIPENLITTITNLYLVFNNLLINRTQRGSIDFDTTEPSFVFDDNGIIENIIPRVRLESHQLIEECMLAANVSVADFLIKNKQPCLFRVHGKPSIDKFNNLKTYINSLGIRFDIHYEKMIPKDYANLVKRVKDHKQFQVIQMAILRSLQLAIYDPNNIGHFGLSFDKYLHFTSPIRRYPDLLVHRAVSFLLIKNLKEPFNYSKPLPMLGEHSSFTERRAEDIERQMDSFYKCLYAKTHIGKEFEGIIQSVVHFGIFVYIPELLVEGLIHIANLGNDYYTFDESKLFLHGKKTGIKYYPGLKIKVEINSVDMTQQFINFLIAKNQ